MAQPLRLIASNTNVIKASNTQTYECIMYDLTNVSDSIYCVNNGDLELNTQIVM